MLADEPVLVINLVAIDAQRKGTTLKRLVLVGLLAASGPVHGASVLPLRSGTYVLSGTPCRDAPFAAMMRFDSKGLSDPHSAQCRSRILARSGSRYRLTTTCRANGDGSPATPTTKIATMRIRTTASFVYVAAGPISNGSIYRLCATSSSDR
jgi:hypothetical protein